jgi:signal transduction histidine kinase
VQIETRDDNASSNLGLGLYIAREIVLMHGGTIGAESDDAGTVFSARLPRSRPEQRLATPSP